MDGFSLDEAGGRQFGPPLVCGGFPRSLFAGTESESVSWRREFVRSFVEPDLPQIGSGVSSSTIRRFWAMLPLPRPDLERLRVRPRPRRERSERAPLRGLLIETFVARRLLPWSENLGKRQVKSPKLYIADPGILHSLLGIENRAGLENHPKVGGSWEGFGITHVAERLGVSRDECYFWATQAGAELDLLVVRGERRMGFEFKRTMAPQVTKSMHICPQ